VQPLNRDTILPRTIMDQAEIIRRANIEAAMTTANMAATIARRPVSPAARPARNWRWPAGIAAAVATGTLTYLLADGELQPILTRCMADASLHGLHCIEPGEGPATALAGIAAIAGFWFVWTGRLAQQLRPVR